MKETVYLDRAAYTIENEILRVTIMARGGHIAELRHKPSDVNPLWQPPWPTIEPSQWSGASEPLYGSAHEGKMLSCVIGHFLCIGTFGPPSPEEQASSAIDHGEALLSSCAISGDELSLRCIWNLEADNLLVRRELSMANASPVLRIVETVQNFSPRDYPVAWTQHVTLGPPFLRRGETEFRIPDVRSVSIEGVESGPARASTLTASKVSGGFVTHQLDPSREQAYFVAYSPSYRILHGYIWNRSDFPWIGIWEENRLRQHSPWRGETLAQGMEFGVSPFPESRRNMIERGQLFGTPCFRWIPAKSEVSVEYCAFLCEGNSLPEDIYWDRDMQKLTLSCDEAVHDAGRDCGLPDNWYQFAC